MIGMFFARYDFVIAGQLVPIVGREALWEYTPNVIEVLTVLGAISFCLLLYSVADRVLPLEDYRLVPGTDIAKLAAQPGPSEDVEMAPDSASAGGPS